MGPKRSKYILLRNQNLTKSYQLKATIATLEADLEDLEESVR